MDDDITALQRQIMELKQQLSTLRRQRPPETVKDHALTAWDGSAVRLSELFGEKDDLIVIHNMGRECVYCTLWADGFNGLLPHLQNRAAFVVVSPDSPATQQAFATSRGWSFPMLSAEGSDFIEAMGFVIEGGYWPGVSAFRRTVDGEMVRTGFDFFGPDDDYSPPWRLFDLLQNGVDGWEPRFDYH